MIESAPIQTVLDRLEGVKAAGEGQWSARCPSHDDQRQSLSVSVGNDGKPLLYCHTGCAFPDIVAKLGWETGDFAPGNAVPRKRVVAARYTYTDETGGPLFQVTRFAPKNFQQRASDGNGGWLEGKGCMNGVRRVLFQLQKLVNTDPTEVVYIVEGEADVLRLSAEGLLATTGSGGASKWRPEYSKTLSGRRVVIIPDADEPGRKHGEQVAESLYGKVASLKVVVLPGAPEHGDVSDWLGLGFTVQELRGLAEATDEWTPPPAGGDGTQAQRSAEPPSAHSKHRGDNSPEDDHQIVAARSAALTRESETFPADALPSPLAEFVAEGAQALGVAPEMLALPALCAVAACIGTTRRLILKGTWKEYPAVWGAVVAESGSLKSPAFSMAMVPVWERQTEALRQHQEALEIYENERLEYERDLAQWRSNRKNHGDPPDRPTKPEAVRYVVSDITVEGLVPILQANPRGLLLARDELSSFFGAFDQYKKNRGADAGCWLEMFRGGTLAVDRKGTDKPVIFVPNALVSIVGTVTPGTLRRALGQEHIENGLAPRFILVRPARHRKQWSDATVSQHVLKAYDAILGKLLTLHHNPAATDGRVRPVDVGLTPEGKAAWVAFYDEFAERQERATSPVARASLSKLEAYCARLALVFHFVQWARPHPPMANPDAVGADSINAAATLVGWAADVAERMYEELAGSDEERAYRDLVEFVEARGGTATVRDLQRGPREFRGHAETARAALDALVKAGLGRWESPAPAGSGGRPTEVFRLTKTGDSGNKTPAHKPESEVLSPSPPNESPRERSGEEVMSPASRSIFRTSSSIPPSQKLPTGDGDRTPRHDPATGGNVTADGVPPGWTVKGWVNRLRKLADACERDHPDKAATYRAQAGAIEGGSTPAAAGDQTDSRPTDAGGAATAAGSGGVSDA